MDRKVLIHTEGVLASFPYEFELIETVYDNDWVFITVRKKQNRLDPCIK